MFLERLQYRFPVGKSLTVFAEATGGDLETINVLSPYVDSKTKGVSSGTGSFSRYSRFSPIYRIDAGTATGVVLDYKFSTTLNGSIGYLAANANNSSPGNGVFNGGYGALAQVNYHPDDRLDVALTYAHTYGISPVGNTGSNFANNPFAPPAQESESAEQVVTNARAAQSATTSNSYGVEAKYKVSDRVTVSGWVDFTNAVSEVTKQRATISNWNIALAFPDLGKKDAVAGITFGQPPKVTANDISSRQDKGTSHQLELFYRYPVTEHLEITPGFFVIFNPENNSANDSIYVGGIRTRLTF